MSHIGWYIDFFIQPLVRKTSPYLKNTRDTIKLLEAVNVAGDYIMATADVASLYTCISPHKGIEAVWWFLGRDPTLTLVQAELIIELLEFAA